jgi:hypothetical protein
MPLACFVPSEHVIDPQPGEATCVTHKRCVGSRGVARVTQQDCNRGR